MTPGSSRNGRQLLPFKDCKRNSGLKIKRSDGMIWRIPLCSESGRSSRVLEVLENRTASQAALEVKNSPALQET